MALISLTKIRLVFQFNNADRITYAFKSLPPMTPSHPLSVWQSEEYFCLIINKYTFNVSLLHIIIPPVSLAGEITHCRNSAVMFLRLN